MKRLMAVGVMVVLQGCIDFDGLGARLDGVSGDAGPSMDGGVDAGSLLGDAGEPLAGADTSMFPNAGQVVSIYGSKYPSVQGTVWDEFFAANWSAVTDVTLADGRAVKRYDLHHFASMGFPMRVDASSMNFLHVDLWFVTVPPAFEVRAADYLTDGGVSSNGSWLPPLVERTWLSYELPLANFQPPLSPRDGIGQLLWMCELANHQPVPSSEHHVVYLDNLFFHQ
jgi:hypothetical protein